MNAALSGKFWMSLARESSQIKKVNKSPAKSRCSLRSILLFRSETVWGMFVWPLCDVADAGVRRLFCCLTGQFSYESALFPPMWCWSASSGFKTYTKSASVEFYPARAQTLKLDFDCFFIILSEAGGESLPSFIIRLYYHRPDEKQKNKNLISLYHYRHWGVSSFHVLIDLTAFCKKAIIGESLQVTACGESDWQYIYMYILLHRAAAEIWRWETGLDDNLVVNIKQTNKKTSCIIDY